MLVTLLENGKFILLGTLKNRMSLI